LTYLNLTDWINSTDNLYVAMTVMLGDVNDTARDQIRCQLNLNTTGN